MNKVWAFFNGINITPFDSINQLVFKGTEEIAQRIFKPLLEKITKKRIELSFDKTPLKK